MKCICRKGMKDFPGPRGQEQTFRPESECPVHRKLHTLVITIENEGFTRFKVECPFTGIPVDDRPCGCYSEGNSDEPCRCPEIGDGKRCEACEAGEHDACAWGRTFEEIGPECLSVPEEGCGYQLQIDNVGSDCLEFGKGEFEFRLPVELSQSSWDDPIIVKREVLRSICSSCDGTGILRGTEHGDVVCDHCDGDGYEPADS